MTDRIDAHHHFWHYQPNEFGWISNDMSHLRQDFLPQHLEPLMLAAHVDGVVSVQTRQSLEETSWLLQVADKRKWVRGVVGWAPIASPNFSALLEELVQHPKLKGLRHIIQDEPDDHFILNDAFNEGLGKMQATGLVYDILVYARHLPHTIEFVDRHPNQIFVLDHLAKPSIRTGEMGPWVSELRELARRSNVHCKVSGMVTEADPKRWSTADLEPYWRAVLEAFGPHRILAGSDWPVCELASSYVSWFEVLQGWKAQLSSAEQDAILGGNAIEVYRLGT